MGQNKYLNLIERLNVYCFVDWGNVIEIVTHCQKQKQVSVLWIGRC